MKNILDLKYLLWPLIVVFLTACAGKTVVESDLRIKGAPDWVNEGTNILNDKKGRLFHGVGSAPPMGDESLQKSTADNRARAELARIFTSYMEVVNSDYLATAGSGESRANEEAISQQIKSVSKTNLVGAKIIGRWRDKRTDNIYSIAEMDVQRLKGTVSNFEAMNDSLRTYIENNAEKIFDRMEMERGTQ